ncbi:hypothetical protein C8F01DRAFT_622266 [Mycena amicta]|nr:hypothetical protein C8F01DRAFT_622266 [Mycena amicta]
MLLPTTFLVSRPSTLRFKSAKSEEDTLISFVHAPLLRSLKLRATPPSCIELRWSQLTELKVDALTLNECIEALRLAPNIIHADFELASGGPSRRELSDTPFTHTRLQHLRLLEAELRMTHNEKHALEYLTLPKLQSLELGRDTALTQETVDEFLQRCLPPLQKLVLKCQGGMGGGLKYWTSMEPFIELPITTLELEHPFPYRFFEFLGSDDSFLPALRSLSVRIPENYLTGLDDLMRQASAAIAKRLLLPTDEPFPLQSLRLVSSGHYGAVFSFPVDHEATQSLRGLQQAGWDIYAGTPKQRVV